MSSPCAHNPYWAGIYGTCMACRAEKAEAALSAAELAAVKACARLVCLVSQGKPENFCMLDPDGLWCVCCKRIAASYPAAAEERG